MKWTYKLKNAGNGFMVSDEEHGNLCDVFMTNDPKGANVKAFYDETLTCAFCFSHNVRNTETDHEDIFWSLCDDCEAWTEYQKEDSPKENHSQ